MESLKARGCCREKQLEISDNNSSAIEYYFSSCGKLDSYDWLREVSEGDIPQVVEIRFKNTRKGFYANVNELQLRRGDIVAVEASPGHDIGIINLAGEIVDKQRAKARNTQQEELKKVYRRAKEADIESWKLAISKERETMLRSRQISNDLGLNMKIGDVEFQGDNTKAIFYYIADERVDFRQLIKVLAETFRIRIEMRQIGARQEAGKIGGIGTCGRELCCSTFVTNFISVSTYAARVQEMALNPQKLAGQCGKLKCCLNYELTGYEDARRTFPKSSIPLRTVAGNANLLKTDVYRGILWYGYEGSGGQALVPVPVERVNEIMEMNRAGKLPDELVESSTLVEKKKLEYTNGAGEESLTRFESSRPKKKKKKAPPPAQSTKKTMISQRIPGAIFFIILITACDSGMVYDSYTSFDNGMWKWNDVAVFEMEVSDTVSLNNIYLQVRHSTDYPMSNLYMFVNVKGPNGQFRRDTVNLILATPEGQWIGKGTGRLRELRLLYKSQTRFGTPGLYNFSIEQAMRKAELPVTDVGIRVERIRSE